MFYYIRSIKATPHTLIALYYLISIVSMIKGGNFKSRVENITYHKLNREELILY